MLGPRLPRCPQPPAPTQRGTCRPPPCFEHAPALPSRDDEFRGKGYGAELEERLAPPCRISGAERRCIHGTLRGWVYRATPPELFLAGAGAYATLGRPSPPFPRPLPPRWLLISCVSALLASFPSSLIYTPHYPHCPGLSGCLTRLHFLVLLLTSVTLCHCSTRSCCWGSCSSH